MKIYIMSRIEDDKILKPKVSKDFKNLENEMVAEYEKVLKDAGSLGHIYKSKDGSVVVNYGASIFKWKIDEIMC